MQQTGKSDRGWRLAAIIFFAAAISGGAFSFYYLMDDARASPFARVVQDEQASRWRGLDIAFEHRCTPYDRNDYPYLQSIEARIVAAQEGRIYSPYTGQFFQSTHETDIEHIVATSEAHDSGLCAAPDATRQRFAMDLFNLTLAPPHVNRCDQSGKCAYDAAQWLPPMNRCWFAARIVAVRVKYQLSVDRREAQALERVLSSCVSTKMIIHGEAASHRALDATVDDALQKTAPPLDADALRAWDDNGNGRITCEEARRHAIAPVPRGHAAYPFMVDRDGDGTVCE